MPFLCLWNPAWRTAPEVVIQAALLEIVPRVVAAGEIVWGDIRGLPLSATIDRIVHLFQVRKSDVPKIGVAATPIAAEVAARYAPQMITQVPDGEDRAFLAPFPISVLHPDLTLANFLEGIGIERCEDLARLSQESVEVRLGAAGVHLWRLARADDSRPVFTPIPPSLPEASFEWTDYTVRRAERLVFVINALCQNVCESLRARGLGAVVMTLHFSLANQTSYEHPVRAARATAGQSAWMRLFRLALEEIVLPDGVTGITLRVTNVAELGDKQGDIFDRGFTTAHAAEEAIAQLLDDQGAIVAEPDNTRHPLLDRRTTWIPLQASQISEYTPCDRPTPALVLQLLPTPRRITVSTLVRRDHEVPHTYRDGNTVYKVVDVAGPDFVSGEQWDRGYTREYFRCVTHQGALVWLYRDTRTGAWYLHGWWD
jgi:protein ImuB